MCVSVAIVRGFRVCAFTACRNSWGFRNSFYLLDGFLCGSRANSSKVILILGGYSYSDRYDKVTRCPRSLLYWWFVNFFFYKKMITFITLVRHQIHYLRFGEICSLFKDVLRYQFYVGSAGIIWDLVLCFCVCPGVYLVSTRGRVIVWLVLS